jgi:hypothetical protein
MALAGPPSVKEAAWRRAVGEWPGRPALNISADTVCRTGP